MNKYKDAMDRVHFSEDIESRLLISLKKIDSGSRIKKTDFYIISGLLIGCVSVMLIGIMLCGNTQLRSDFISIENVKEIPCVEKVRDIVVIGDEGKYRIEPLHIDPGEMVIFIADTGLTEEKKSFLKGKFTGTDICCSMGYIFEGNYYEIKNDITESNVAENIPVLETGNYYWCIVNTSAEQMLFEGNIQIEVKDLLFRDYGDDAIVVDQPCIFLISGINFIETDLNESIDGIYVYHHQTQQTTRINYSTDNTDIVYQVNEPGAYTIYTINKEGGMVNLKDFVSIEYESNGYSGPTLL